jgi:molybdopterin-biosynthesis enzyme MoeA-like protein
MASDPIFGLGLVERQMAFGVIVVGDEILVGKRRDKHMAFAIEALARRGLRLAWAEYHGDDPVRLTAALGRSFARGDIVFSFGGIGATPDDHTRKCAADALDVPLALHPDAEREIRARFGTEITPQRLRMGEFPRGCEIVPNPFNRIPGFSVRGHHFFPGFPQMAWPMMEWVLDTHYRALFDRDRWDEASILVYECGESQLIPAMEYAQQHYPQVKAFSLPSMGPNASRRHVELGVRGEPGQVAAAIEDVRRIVRELGFAFEDAAAPGTGRAAGKRRTGA